jgi:hypothetical protein
VPTVITFKGGPAAGQVLALRRAPLFLRVTHAREAFDALDQLDDTPAEGEQLYAYRRVGEAGSVHLCVRGKNRGASGRYAVAAYEAVEPQPDDATMRSTGAWRDWCRAQVRPKAEEGAVAMIDVRCPACRHRYGYCGTIAGRPACPQCGHQVPREDLEADQARAGRLEALLSLPGAASVSRCKSCQAELLWVVTAAGKVAPLDPDPSPKGNVRLAGDRCEVLGAEAAAAARAGGERLWLSHFVSCPHSSQHRRS